MQPLNLDALEAELHQAGSARFGPQDDSAAMPRCPGAAGDSDSDTSERRRATGAAASRRRAASADTSDESDLGGLTTEESDSASSSRSLGADREGEAPTTPRGKTEPDLTPKAKERSRKRTMTLPAGSNALAPGSGEQNPAIYRRVTRTMTGHVAGQCLLPADFPAVREKRRASFAMNVLPALHNTGGNPIKKTSSTGSLGEKVNMTSASSIMTHSPAPRGGRGSLVLMSEGQDSIGVGSPALSRTTSLVKNQLGKSVPGTRRQSTQSNGNNAKPAPMVRRATGELQGLVGGGGPPRRTRTSSFALNGVTELAKFQEQLAVLAEQEGQKKKPAPKAAAEDEEEGSEDFNANEEYRSELTDNFEAESQAGEESDSSQPGCSRRASDQTAKKKPRGVMISDDCDLKVFHSASKESEIKKRRFRNIFRFGSKQSEDKWVSSKTPWVFGSAANILFGGAIALNALYLGIETDRHKYLPDLPEAFWLAVESLFLCFFVMELMTRWWYHDQMPLGLDEEPIGFFKYTWNVVDSFIVVVGCVDTFLITIMLQKLFGLFGNSSGEEVFGIFQILRLVRLLRLLRIIRIFRFLKELLLLAQGIVGAMKALVWALLLVFLTLYSCSIVTTRLIGQAVMRPSDDCISMPCPDELMSLADYNQIIGWFGNVGDSIFTLFQIMTLEGWVEVARKVRASSEWGYVWVLFFMIIVMFTNWVLLNLVTGVILENVLAISRREEEKLLQKEEAKRTETVERIHQIFHAALGSLHSGEITLEDFRHACRKPQVIRQLQSLQIATYEAEELFILMDIAKKGSINVDHFIEGCLRVRGPARAKHLLGVQFDVQKVWSKLSDQMDDMEDRLRAELMYVVDNVVMSMEEVISEAHENTQSATKNILKKLFKGSPPGKRKGTASHSASRKTSASNDVFGNMASNEVFSNMASMEPPSETFSDPSVVEVRQPALKDKLTVPSRGENGASAASSYQLDILSDVVLSDGASEVPDFEDLATQGSVAGDEASRLAPLPVAREDPGADSAAGVGADSCAAPAGQGSALTGAGGPQDDSRRLPPTFFHQPPSKDSSPQARESPAEPPQFKLNVERQASLLERGRSPSTKPNALQVMENKKKKDSTAKPVKDASLFLSSDTSTSRRKSVKSTSPFNSQAGDDKDEEAGKTVQSRLEALRQLDQQHWRRRDAEFKELLACTSGLDSVERVRCSTSIPASSRSLVPKAVLQKQGSDLEAVAQSSRVPTTAKKRRSWHEVDRVKLDEDGSVDHSPGAPPSSQSLAFPGRGNASFVSTRSSAVDGHGPSRSMSGRSAGGRVGKKNSYGIADFAAEVTKTRSGPVSDDINERDHPLSSPSLPAHMREVEPVVRISQASSNAGGNLNWRRWFGKSSNARPPS